MKTKQQIEKMKCDIEKGISEYSEKIQNILDGKECGSIHLLGDKKRQLCAQYAIILEVLK